MWYWFTVYFVVNLFFYYSFRIHDNDKVWIKVFYNNQMERKFSKNEVNMKCDTIIGEKMKKRCEMYFVNLFF